MIVNFGALGVLSATQNRYGSLKGQFEPRGLDFWSESILGIYESTLEFESRFWSFKNHFKSVKSFSKTSVLTPVDKFPRSFVVARATLNKKNGILNNIFYSGCKR